MLPARSAEFAAGVRAQLPLLLGVTPFGMAYGAYAVESGLSPGFAQAMSVVVFGGASQFVGARQIAAEVPGIAIVLTTFLVNSRHMLYSASLAPHLDHLSSRWRWLFAYLLTDEAFVTADARYKEPDSSPNKHWFLLGTALALWMTWQISSIVGVVLGSSLPASWSLEFALPLTFIAIVVPALLDRPAIAAAVVAGISATIGARWSYGLDVLLPVLAGVAAAIALAGRFPPANRTERP